MNKQKDYYIGIDKETASVGWAVVNPDYEIVKKRETSLWGVRLSDLFKQINPIEKSENQKVN